MSAGSSRPPVPRPTPRASTVPPPPASTVAPKTERSDPPSSPVIEIPKAYASSPPVIRDRAPSTLELADDDLLEEKVVAKRPRSTPPPPPPAKKSLSAPKPPALLVPEPITKAAPRIAPLPLPLPRFEPIVKAAPPIVPAAQAEPAPALVSVPAPVAEIEAPPESHVATKAPLESSPVVTRSAPIATPVVDVPAVPTREPRVESTLDPMDVLFDGIYELNFVDTAVEAADVCAGALAKALRARAVVIHTHDLVAKQLRAIGVHGVSPSKILFSSEASEDDLVASAVICNQAPVTMRFDGELPKLAPQRLSHVGAPRTLVAVPALAWGRCVALIEVIDADDRVAHRVADSAAYVAERLAEFLSERAAA